MNVADAESPVGLPVTVIVYDPAEVEATINEADTAPLLIEQVSDATALPPAKAQEESLDENPEPDTWTVAPTPALGGLTETVGTGGVTWKLAEAESPPGLAVAVTT